MQALQVDIMVCPESIGQSKVTEETIDGYVFADWKTQHHWVTSRIALLSRCCAIRRSSKESIHQFQAI